MKKFIAIALVAVCACGLSLGCKKPATDAPAPTTPAATETPEATEPAAGATEEAAPEATDAAADAAAPEAAAE